MIAPADFAFTKDQLLEAEARCRKNPASTTDRDLQMFAVYDVAYAAKAAGERERAQTPKQIPQPVPAPQRPHQQQYPANDIIMKWFTEAAPEDDDVWPALKKAIDVNPLEPISVATFACLAGLVLEINKKNRERNARLKALEASGGATPATDDVRIKALEARIRELENRPAALKYAGIFDPRRTYEKDEACTDNGSLWIARRSTKLGEKPGDDSLAFQLAVKHGRDLRAPMSERNPK